MSFDPDETQSSSSGGGGPVWMPHATRVPHVIEYAPGYRIIDGSRSAAAPWSQQRANDHFFEMGDKDLTRLSRQVEGFSGNKNPAGSTLAYYWQTAVSQAASLNARNPEAKVSPWDIFAKWSKNGGPSGSGNRNGGGGSGSGGSRSMTSTSVNRQVQTINANQAKALIKTSLEQMNGRSYSAKEVHDFVEQFNAAARANPSVTRSTTHTTASASSSSSSTSSTTSGGVDAGQLAQDFARSRPDWAEYQTAVPLMDAFMSALQSPTGG